MMSAWFLILIFTARETADTSTQIGPFTTKEACVAAGNAVHGVDGYGRWVCVSATGEDAPVTSKSLEKQ